MKDSPDKQDNTKKIAPAEIDETELNVDKLLLDSIPHPAMIINKDRVILAANKIALEVGAVLNGYCWRDFGHCQSIRDKTTRTPLVLSQLKSYNGVQCYFCQADEALTEGEAKNDGEVKVNGAIYDTHWIPLGKNDLYLHYAIDVTEKKRIEQAALEYERLTATGEMAAGIAHNFNNALQSILGHIELALSTNDISAETRADLEVAKQAASDVGNRIKQLNRFAGQKTPESNEYKNIGIEEVINDTISQAKLLIGQISHEQGINIEIEFCNGTDYTILGDPAELRTVLLNSIKNSIEALPLGGKIKIETRKDKNDVVIAISDNGVGMSREIQKRIFQPFYSTKGFEQRRGLGMSNAFAIMRDHNGSISVAKSAPNQGTTIEVRLPYIDKSSIANEETKIEHNGSARVLWVDDDDLIRNFVGKLLVRLNHKADIADSGYDALELLAKNEYDLLVTDIGMPGMSGWDLLNKIQGQYPKMKVAVITGWNIDTCSDKSKDLGADYILGKPVDTNDIKNLIGEALKKKNAQQ